MWPPQKLSVALVLHLFRNTPLTLFAGMTLMCCWQSRVHQPAVSCVSVNEVKSWITPVTSTTGQLTGCRRLELTMFEWHLPMTNVHQFSLQHLQREGCDVSCSIHAIACFQVLPPNRKVSYREECFSFFLTLTSYRTCPVKRRVKYAERGRRRKTKGVFNPFNPKLIMQILPTIQEENDWVV